MSQGDPDLSMDGGRFYKKHRKQLGVRKNMQKFLGGFLNEAISDGNVVTAPPTDLTDPIGMAGGMKRAAMKRAAMKRAAMKRAAMKKRSGGEGEDSKTDVPALSQDGGKKRGLKNRGLKKRTPKYRKTGGEVTDPPVGLSSVRSFLNQLSSGGGKKKVATPARRRVASPVRRRVASPVRRRRRSASPVRRSLF